MNRINNRLPMRSYVVDTLIQIEDPIQRLLWRRDVVPLGAKDNNWRAYVAQVHASTVARSNLRRRQFVSDEELINDKLHFRGIEQNVTAPPLFELKIAGWLGVDLGIKIMLFRPIRVGWIEALKVADNPCAVELAIAEITHQCRQPATAEQSTRVAHGILAVYSSPIRERR